MKDAITEEEEKALEMFMSNEAPQRMTLADIIMQKIKEQESVSKLQLGNHSIPIIILS